MPVLFDVYDPTETQLERPTHDTPMSELLCAPAGGAAGSIVHRVRFPRTINVEVFVPVATQLTVPHETPDSRLNAPVPLPVDTTDQRAPFQCSTSAAPAPRFQTPTA